MRLARPLLLFCLMIMATLAIGQSRTYNGKKLSPLRSYDNPASVRSKKGSSVPVFDEAGYPYQGIGIKLGDPMALTFKFYFSERLALEADFGRALSGLYSSYSEGLFDTFFSEPSKTFSYDDHAVDKDWTGNLKILYHIPAENLVKSMRAYTGLGWQVRDARINYTYLVTSQVGTVPETTDVRYQTQGATLTLGVEHNPASSPIVLFAEGVLFYDLDKDPGRMRVQGGVGLRYVF
ncbi:MAG: hypothetical protein MUE95_01600 [Cyclobacteriaceae bacterium]|nr:hypothetical protein [Cyclobacteriaceae bacterium]